jgi:glycosyltransferase involved in cell wall biosynthesis
VLELEQQGVDLRIFSLKRPTESVTHSQTKRVRSPVTYLPQRFMAAPFWVLGSQLRVWRAHPKRWRRNLRNAATRSRADGDWAELGSFFQACCLVQSLRGIRHLHAHYANVPAKIALLAQRLSGVSYSITTHAKDIFQNDPFKSPKLLERMGRARFIVANSRFSAEHIRSSLGTKAEVQVVYNGLDLESFPYRTCPASQPTILGVGRLVEKKGFQHLIEACRILKRKGIKFACEIVGTGVLSAQLKERIRMAGVGQSVRLVGPLPQEILKEHYRKAAVFALPCVRAADGDRDILPNAIKEAMAVGAPVVTTRLEGIEELVEDGVSGLLVEPGDASALARCVERLLTEPRLGQKLSQKARLVIEQRFDRRNNFARLKTLLLDHAAAGALGLVEAQPENLGVYDANCVH